LHLVPFFVAVKDKPADKKDSENKEEQTGDRLRRRAGKGRIHDAEQGVPHQLYSPRGKNAGHEENEEGNGSHHGEFSFPIKGAQKKHNGKGKIVKARDFDYNSAMKKFS
jgi:hypothetical protein